MKSPGILSFLIEVAHKSQTAEAHQFNLFQIFQVVWKMQSCWEGSKRCSDAEAEAISTHVFILLVQAAHLTTDCYIPSHILLLILEVNFKVSSLSFFLLTHCSYVIHACNCLLHIPYLSFPSSPYKHTHPNFPFISTLIFSSFTI